MLEAAAVFTEPEFDHGKSNQAPRVDQAGCSRAEIIGPCEKAGSKNREGTQADSRRNTAEGILTWRVIGLAVIARCRPGSEGTR